MDNEFLYQNKSFKDRRRKLRNNPTPAEKLLWGKIKSSQLGFKFTRQYSAWPYILDFYCPKLRLAIELDGNQHKEKGSVLYDKDREKYLESIDISVIRFWNSEVTSNLKMVLDKILEQCSNMEAPA